MTNLNELVFYATKEHPCSYLKDQQATTVFVDPNQDLDKQLYSELSSYGFRRSGSHVYRPNCQQCNACIPIRLPVSRFSMSRSQKRCAKRNADLNLSFAHTIDTDEHYALYEKYISLRHANGDMYPPSRRQYRDFLTSEWGVTRFLEFRDEQRLIAVSVADQLEDGISAIYAFFDPDEEARSLGVFNILTLVDWAKETNNDFVFLGYWIKNCVKMSYKTQYRPFQLLVNSVWVTISDMHEK